MKGTIASRIELALKSGDAFTLQVVFCGKVKPVEFALYRVFDDGFDMAPFGDPGGGRAFYPLSGMQSILIDWAEKPEAPEATPEETPAE